MLAGEYSHWVWNGHVPLHEWNSGREWKDEGRQHYGLDRRTWVVEEESFVPMALLLNGKVCSIATDQLGTPTEAYNADGEEVWRRRLNMNGNYARFSSGHSFCFGANPFFVGLLLHFLLPIFRPVGGMSGFFSMSKSVCADCEDDSSSVLRYMDAAGRREKGKLCLFKRKDKSFVSNRRRFCETIFRFSSRCGDE